MASHVFFKGRCGGDLSQNAERLFADLGITQFHARDSSNYIGDEYYRGKAMGLKICLARADEQELSDEYLWLAIDSDQVWMQSNSFWNLVADFMARVLTAKGYSVIRPEDFGSLDGRWIVYHLRNPDASYNEDSIVTEIWKPT